MGRFLSRLGPMAVLAALGFAVIRHGAGPGTALVMAGGVFTIALAVYIRD